MSPQNVLVSAQDDGSIYIEWDEAMEFDCAAEAPYLDECYAYVIVCRFKDTYFLLVIDSKSFMFEYIVAMWYKSHKTVSNPTNTNYPFLEGLYSFYLQNKSFSTRQKPSESSPRQLSNGFCRVENGFLPRKLRPL